MVYVAQSPKQWLGEARRGKKRKAIADRNEKKKRNGCLILDGLWTSE